MVIRWISLVVFALVTWLPLTGCSSSKTSQQESADLEETATDEAEEDDGSGSLATNNKSKRKTPRPGSLDEDHPEVVLTTSLGDIRLKLETKKAPSTVRNFLNYVESGYYNRTIFHEVDAGYVVLGGGYTSTLSEKAGRYPIKNEANNGLKNRRGTIAMARQIDNEDSSVCQFFLNLADNPGLDYRGPKAEEFGFCVFGQVIDGLDVLDEIGAVDVHDTDQFEKLPVETVLIESATRVR